MTSDLVIVAVFGAVYLGMALGRWPGLAVDRTGVALIGAIALIVTGSASGPDALGWIDFPTLGILFALMVLSAQFAASGFFERTGAAIAGAALSPRRVLALVVALSGVLSAFLTNDVVVFAITPVLIAGLRARGLDPRPFIVALAAAANAGSAATLIGNPQNLLIGEVGGLDFWAFFSVCAVPAALSLALVYGVTARVWRSALMAAPAPSRESLDSQPPLDRRALIKAVLGVLLVVIAFTATEDRAAWSLAVAGALLMSRTLSTRRMLSMVDWHLLALFASLFIVTGALSETDIAKEAMAGLGEGGGVAGVLPLAGLSLVGSNSIGNVPLVVMALSLVPDLGAASLYALALFSTLAGNFLIVGSMANIIAVERAKLDGVTISFGDYARVGAPLTLASFAAAYGWLLLLGPQ